MQKLFIKRKCVSIESLYDMRYDDVPEEEARVESHGVSTTDLDKRSTTLKNLNPNEYPEVCRELLTLIPGWNKDLEEDYKVKELQYLIYHRGDHFKRHTDSGYQDLNTPEGKRVFSTSTVISMTDDIQGGKFLIWDIHNGSHQVDIEVGETIFFDSRSPHEITKVLSGTREVLVAWIHKR